MTRQKQHAIFLMYHGAGHFNACFHLARVMASGYDVTFVGLHVFEHHVSSQGFKYYSLNTVPFGTGLEHWYNQVKKKKFLYLNTLIDRWTNTLYHLRDIELSRMIQTLQPDLLLLDAQLATDFVVLYPLLKRHEIRFAMLHTMLPLTLNNAAPPMSSLAMPEDASAENKKLEKKLSLKYFGQKLKYLGKDDRSIIRRNALVNDIPLSMVNYRSSFGISIDHVPELILSPARLNFNEVRIGMQQQHLGFCIDLARIESTDESYLRKRDDFFSEVQTKRRKVIYCSFGTIAHENQQLVLSLLEKIILATQAIPCILLVSLRLDEAQVKAYQSDKVFIFRHLPQLEILSRASLFITHGGLNSIKEAIAAAVPMLVYPVQFKADQPGNAARVQYHQLGLLGDARKDDAVEVKEKILRLLTENSFKNNLEAFRDAEKEMDDETLRSIVHAIPEFKS